MMKLPDVRAKAKAVGITEPATDRTELIRQIQAYEGFAPCFKSKDSCDQPECCWYKECLKR
ncbi:MAG: hypothetical protein MUF22_06150 [Chitinispirillaceae bacterium]|jgi:hypothetical protein|nr:hypothetical protein [Chitinispirillaceae bacterium]